MDGDFRLSKALKANLASLARTQTLMDQTIARLSTGQKVNYALENPQSFFASAALTDQEKAIFAAVEDGKSLNAAFLSAATKAQQDVLRLFDRPVEHFQQPNAVEDLYTEIQLVLKPLTPAARFLIVVLIWPIITGVLGNLASVPVQDFIAQKAAGAQHSVAAISAPVELPDVRFALSDGVRIRKLPNTKAEVISRLHRGEIVGIKKVQGGWLLISVHGGETEIVGWVYSNTLGKMTRY